jgi:hypothetical protein
VVEAADDVLHGRPLLTRRRPAALQCWDTLAERSAAFQPTQRLLAILWGVGLIAEAAVRIEIVEHYPVDTAAGLVNVAAGVIMTALCVVTRPLGAACGCRGSSPRPSTKARRAT